MSFSLTTYNVLAQAYITPARYPRTPASILASTWRRPALVRYLGALATDVICLQEVEDETFAAVQQALQPLGYTGHFARKGAGKPDGCATFLRRGPLVWGTVHTLMYRDGAGAEADSGHLALAVVCTYKGRSLGLVNTHLQWDAPDTSPDRQRGYRQILQLLQARDQIAPACEAWIICGDFNVTPESHVVSVLRAAGFDYTHRTLAGTSTCNANARAKMIDYVFYPETVRPQPVAVPAIDDQTPLPSDDHPSDHLAVMAHFEWVL